MTRRLLSASIAAVRRSRSSCVTVPAYNALVERAIAIGAEDMNVPIPEEKQEEGAAKT